MSVFGMEVSMCFIFRILLGSWSGEGMGFSGFLKKKLKKSIFGQKNHLYSREKTLTIVTDL